MKAYYIEKRGSFSNVFSILSTISRLSRTTPLGKKAITAAKFVISIILFAALMLFSTGIMAQDHVEFSLSENINFSNAFVRISSNGSYIDVIASEIILNYTLYVNLSGLTIPRVGEIYVDLISDGEVIDSRKIIIENTELEILPVDEITDQNNTEEQQENTSTEIPVINLTNETIEQNLTEIEKPKKKHNRFYKVNSRGKDLSLEITGLYDNPLVQTVEEQIALFNGQNITLNTDIIAVNESEFDNATIVLPKNGKVNKILRCLNWNFENARCNGSWAVSEINFEQNETHLWFTVNTFSGYAGAEITVLDVYSYPKAGDIWTVRFNTSGKANLTITPVNGANWTEFLKDLTETSDELGFESLKCGNNALNSSMLLNDGFTLRRFDSITTDDSIIGQSITIPDYECNETASISNKVLIAGYAALKFEFGNSIAFAYDPVLPCLTPVDNLEINDTSTLCNNTFNIKDIAQDGVILIRNNSITLNCNSTIIDGDSAGIGINISLFNNGPIGSTRTTNNITIVNCTIIDYKNAILISDVSNVTIENLTAEGIKNGTIGKALINITNTTNTSIVKSNLSVFKDGDNIITIAESSEIEISWNNISIFAPNQNISAILLGRQVGISIGMPNNTRIRNNIIHGNESGGAYPAIDAGVYLFNTTIELNSITYFAGALFSGFNSRLNDSIIRRNYFNISGTSNSPGCSLYAIDIGGSRNLIDSNNLTLSDQTGTGTCVGGLRMGPLSNPQHSLSNNITNNNFTRVRKFIPVGDDTSTSDILNLIGRNFTIERNYIRQVTSQAGANLITLQTNNSNLTGNRIFATSLAYAIDLDSSQYGQNILWNNHFYNNGTSDTSPASRGNNTFCYKEHTLGQSFGNFYQDNIPRNSRFTEDCGGSYIEYPLGGETIAKGNITINWTKQSAEYKLNYTIQYSTNAGSTWTTLAQEYGTEYLFNNSKQMYNVTLGQGQVSQKYFEFSVPKIANVSLVKMKVFKEDAGSNIDLIVDIMNDTHRDFDSVISVSEIKDISLNLTTSVNQFLKNNCTAIPGGNCTILVRIVTSSPSGNRLNFSDLDVRYTNYLWQAKDFASGNYIINITPHDSFANASSNATGSFVLGSIPKIQGVNITVLPANTTTNLTCNFIITDSDSGDPLSANVSWFNGTVNYKGFNISVTNGTVSSQVLQAPNTTKNENWTCSVVAYDGISYGATGNASAFIYNILPTQGTPILNSSSNPYLNRSNENLTVYNISTADIDNDRVTNVINWYRNETSIFLLNQPFDTNYSNFSIINITRDYSGNGLNGTGGKNANSSQVPRWNNTGISGGALIFDGLNDAIEFQGMPSRISNVSGAYEFWIMMKANINNSDGTTQGIIDTSSTQTDFELYKENSGENNITFKVIDGSGATHTISYAPVTQGWLKNVWHHVVVTWDTQFGVRIYDNGTLIVTNSSALSTFRKSTGNTLYFGTLGNGIDPDTRTMNATFDEFRIYNISLTPEQIRTNYNRGIAISNIIEASMTKNLENWTACLTVNDGQEDGATTCSNNLTINDIIQIDSCRNITNSGHYALTQSISNSGATTCINITISNVTFDGNGLTIDGTDTASTNGVYAFNSTNTLNNITVKNLVLTDWNNGIFYQQAHNGTIDNVNSNSNANYGIYLLNLFGVNITNSIANSNTNYGIFLFTSTVSNRLVNNTVNGNNNGIYLWDNSNNNTLVNNTVNSNTDFGIIIRASSTFNTLFNNTAGSTSYCYYFLTASNNNLTNNTARSCTIANFYSETGSINNKVTNLDIGPIISFDGKDIVILNVSSPSANPSGFRNIGKFINASNNSADSWLYLNVSYTDSEIASVTESKLRISRHNGTWETNVTIFANFRGVDLTNNYVFANITNFTTGRTFAPLAGNEYPTQGTPILNSTFGNNRSNENLTVYNISTSDPNNDSVTNIINWYRNGTSILLLNQPFDTNYTNISFTNITRDYSGNGFNGTGGKGGNSTQAPRWNNTGISGGALEYDGLNDVMEFKNVVPKINNRTGAFEFWVRMNEDINSSNIFPRSINIIHIDDDWRFNFNKGDGENNLKLNIEMGNGSIEQLIYNGVTYNWMKNVWHHVVITWDPAFGARIYDNGVQVDANATAFDTFAKPRGTHFYLGSGGDGSTAPDNRTLNATFDEFKIYNISLTSAQVFANYNNGVARSNLIESSITKKNEEWQACLTPNDATDDGATTCSNNLTVLNTPPIQGLPILNSSSNTNRSNENLTVYNVSTSDPENDAITNIINWYRNGSSITVLNMPFDNNYSNHSITNIIRDYSGYGNNGTGGNFSADVVPKWNNSCMSGGCYSFDGGDIINISDSYSLDINGDYSIEYWINFNDVTTQQAILSKGRTNSDSLNYHQFISSGTIKTRIVNGDTETFATVGSFSTSTWYHVVFTRNQNTTTYYINGTLMQTNTTVIDPLTNGETLKIGGRVDTSAGILGQFLNGYIDELRIYNISLTTEQVAANYNNRNPKYNIIEQSITHLGERWNASVTPNDGLDDGNTSFTIELTILNSPPTVLLISPNGTTNNISTIQFICNGTDSDDLINMTLYANFTGTFAANTTVALTGFNNQSRINVSGIRDGEIIWNCLATDSSNSAAFNTTVNFTITVDTTIPRDITLNFPSNTINTTLAEIEFNFSAKDNLDTNLTCNLTLNGIINKTKTVLNGSSNTVNVSGLADNTYLWNVTCYDNANNSNVSETRTFTVDRTVPSDITLNSPDNRSNLSSATVTFNISANDNLDANLTCNITLDGVVNKTLGVKIGTPNSSTIPVSNVADGTHLWNATCYDNANNSNTSTTRTFTVDTTKPTVNLSINDSVLEFNFDSIDISWNATDVTLNRYYANVSYPNGSLLNQYTNKSQNITLGPSNLTLTGTYNVTVYATDNADNFNATSLTFLVQDTLSPVSILISPANNTFVAVKNVSFVCNSTNAQLSNASLYTTINGSWSINSTLNISGTANQSNFSVVLIPDGIYVWNCLVKDASNNQAFNSTNYTITIDTTVPSDITLNSPDNRSNLSSATVTFNVSANDNLDANLTCNITLDGVVNKTLGVKIGTPNSSTIPVSNVADGTHLWNATCYDNANNSNTSTTRTFTVDTTKPAVNLSINDSTLEFNFDSIDISWNATDVTLNRYYANVSYPNGSLFNQYTNKSQNITLTPNNLTLTGTYNVTVYATDNANNFNATSLTFLVQDTLSPVSILISPTNNTFVAVKNVSFVCNSTNVQLSNVSLYATINGSWSINATLNISGTANQSNFSVVLIPDGSYLWNCLVKDTSNNQAFNSTNYTITIDTTVPSDITLNSPANRSNLSSTTITFNVSANDNLDANLTCNITIDGIINKTLGVRSGSTNSSSVSISNVADGTHLWNATCYDNANNSNISTTFQFQLETVPPNITIVNPLNTTFNKTDLTINITINEIAPTCNFSLNSGSNLSLFNNGSGTGWGANFTATEGDNNVYATCNDSYNNVNISQRRFFVADITNPQNLNLSAPAEGYSSTSTTVEFNFSATDNIDTNLTCNVTLDNEPVARINLSNGTFRTASVTVSITSHVWNVTCYDNVLNANTSITRTFTITSPPAEPGPGAGGGAGGGGGGGGAPPAQPPVVPPVQPPVVPPQPAPQPVLPPIQQILPGLEPILGNALQGIVGNLAPVPVTIGGKITGKGVEVAFGGKGKIKLETVDKKPKIIIEFGDEDLELYIPEYSEVPLLWPLILILVIVIMMVHGTVHKTYEKYAQRFLITELKKSAISHIKAVVRAAGNKPKPSDLDKCMQIFSVYLARELGIERATYKITIKLLKEKNASIVDNFTEVYKEFSRKGAREITKRELKNFSKNLIYLIRRI